MTTLSIYIPVHNEEEHLQACLETLGFADEVIVMLDKCTDRSKEIAENFKQYTILEGRWDIEGERRNAAIDACSSEWILEVDADERIPTALGEEIREIISKSTHQLHSIPFDHYIGDKLVRYGWGAYIGTMMKIALFRKGAKTYVAHENVHPSPILKGEFGQDLTNRIEHYVDKSLSDTIRRFNSYTTARAKDLVENNELGKESFGRNFRRIFSRFYKCYIRRKGYKSGDLGFFIAMLAGLYPIFSYIKAKHRLF